MSELLAGIRRTALDKPDIQALSGDQDSYSYRDLISAVDSLAAELTQRGIRRVALIADNSPAWLIVDLACLQAGVVLIPIPSYFSSVQFSNTLSSSGADTLISDRPASDPQLQAVLTSGDELSAFNSLPTLSACILASGDKPASLPLGTAKITYTSGSTGAAKGVCLSAANQYATASTLNSALSRVELQRHLAVLPLSTLLENVAGAYAALLRGAEVLLPSLQSLGWAGSSGLGIANLTDTLSRLQPDSAVLLPQLLKDLITVTEQGVWQPPASLRYLAVGGARVAPEQISQARDFGLPVYEGYGLSECGSVVSLNTPGADRAGSAGKILPHCKVEIVDGELMVSGNLYLGYLHDGAEAETSKVLASGDLGKLDEDGFLLLQGRSKNLLVSSYGRNISPEWPESELLAYAGVGQCMVIGDAEAYTSALIFVTPGYSYEDISRYIRECNQRLPDYAQLRRWAAFPKRLTAADGLLSANGRLQRAAILGAYPELVAHCYAGIVYPIGGSQRPFTPSQQALCEAESDTESKTGD